MYYATTNKGNTLPVGERPSWVKALPNGQMVLCPKDKAQGIVINGATYHVLNRPEIDYPTVNLFWQDDMRTIVQAINSGAGAKDNNANTKDHGAVLESAIAFVKTLFKINLPKLTYEEIIKSRGLIENWSKDSVDLAKKGSVFIDNGIVFQAMADTKTRPDKKSKAWKVLEEPIVEPPAEGDKND